ncbi:MAG: low molecular weight protein arginine phosphatase [Candidatus Eremiobacteraeota bacterium]|nr:low molecular weight protein arginine phosphatase [Candidatus Eremiobacteraeota bacterium]
MTSGRQAPHAPPLVLFVCSGNICRSPMAAALAVELARHGGLHIRAASAGTSALVGLPAESTAGEAVAEVGVGLREHIASQVSFELVRDASLVVALTRAHAAWLRARHPAATNIASFDELTGLGDVPDPYGSSLEDYRRVRDQLIAGMPRVLSALVLKAGERAGPKNV